ncbi:hypothetical protein GCM10025734_07170 [Kitasatospora paranensis]|uniref:hypothetical protein n=1 Tax=Kitasatospora paranensis TaxID=258053 RepID=UPI0031E90A61
MPGAAAELRQAAGATASAGSARVVLEESLVSDGKTATVHGEGVARLGGAGNGHFTVTADGRATELRIVDGVVYEQLPAAQRPAGARAGHGSGSTPRRPTRRARPASRTCPGSSRS